MLPNLSTLPDHQRTLWPELQQIPDRFVLYGGTAVAIRLGHRQSVDFDFFSSESFTAEALRGEIPLLAASETLQIATNTLTVSVARGRPVRLSFFGGLGIGRVGAPERCDDNGLWVGALIDLAATKMAVVQQRAERKDYMDIDAILSRGTTLEDALAAAAALYGASFNPLITLKALAYFQDGDLPELPHDVRSRLATLATRVGQIPTVRRTSDMVAASA